MNWDGAGPERSVIGEGSAGGRAKGSVDATPPPPFPELRGGLEILRLLGVRPGWGQRAEGGGAGGERVLTGVWGGAEQGRGEAAQGWIAGAGFPVGELAGLL